MYLKKVCFVLRHAPKRPISSVKSVSGDGFFDKEMIIKLGFLNAEYVADRWHMKDTGLQNVFGSSGYELPKKEPAELGTVGQSAYLVLVDNSLSFQLEHTASDTWGRRGWRLGHGSCRLSLGTEVAKDVEPGAACAGLEVAGDAMTDSCISSRGSRPCTQRSHLTAPGVRRNVNFS